ncbi:hypothetical protein LTR70_006175 [Exophiala xenobiotica]|uniref:WW domain-containing protein n=1 Tax=Lithohypha guttulata TaxID=1690604 RepID=A0ABR0K7T2_9EURO|nr:hypothetical protein LTR24_005852 [Lithohypha guttulata]KAK5316626.1 hypothetical protein LTR70_006175 [Exophiala xenobiotica]
MSDAPPSYDVATGSSTGPKRTTGHLEVPGARNGIHPAHRRSMEDEHRPLPEGWVRQWDDKEQHQFFVDTKATPPRSTWEHPYDDESYMSTLSSEQRERIQEEERQRQIDDHSDDESRRPSSSGRSPGRATAGSSYDQELPPRPSKSEDNSKLGFGEKMKQKLTGQTKEEREEAKRQRDEEERQYYEAHVRFRQCLQRAQATGEPQFFAKGRDGKDIYIEPPSMGYGGMAGSRYGGGYGYNPYTSGPYSTPNARFIRPGYQYQRPYGTRYGGGMGGMLGGMMLGGLMF